MASAVTSVTHVLAPAAFGGLESVVATLAPAQMKAGLKVHVFGVFSEDPSDQPFWDDLRKAGVPRTAIVLPGRAYLRERRALRQHLEGSGPRILHTHGYRPDLVDAPVARRLGVATVTTVHGFTGGDLRNRAYEWLQRRSFRRFAAVVAVSGRMRSELLEAGVPAARLHCIPNAWEASDAPLSPEDARSRLGLEASGRLVGWVGRMTAEKAPGMALQAFVQLAQAPEMDDVDLVMVGSGALESELKATASGAGLSGRVHFPGVVPAASKLLRALDAVVISSLTEGTPMVLLEAMAAGVPIVATRVGGIPDVVDETQGWLVPPGDPGELFRALRGALGNPRVAKARAVAARRRLADLFAVESWVQAYSSVYESAARRRARAL